MATYGNKYYKELNSTSNDDTVYTTILYIDQKDYTGNAMEIGDLQSLQMQIDGDDDPCEPIQKTIVTFTLVDSADKEDTDTVKYGNWQEFYTPDSTKYRVRIVVDDELMWSGYVTPDSWEESLDYRGTVTITARDNIGHLDDFDFDYESEDGLASVQTLLKAALDKIDFAMDVTWLLATNDSYSVKALYTPAQDETVHLGAWRVNLSTYDGESWGTVFETLLSSLGLTFRFVGFNEYICTYLRYLPLLGNKTVLSNTVVSLSGGTRTLDPAYRQIKDTLSYDHEDTLAYDIFAGINLAQSYTSYDASITYKPTGLDPKTRASTGIAQYNGNPGDRGWQAGYGFFAADGYTYRGEYWAEHPFDPATTVLLVANDSSGAPAAKSYVFGDVHVPQGTITLQFLDGAYTINTRYTKTLSAFSAQLMSMTYVIRYTSTDGVNYYWTGNSWSTTLTELSYTYAEDTDSGTISIDLANYSDGTQSKIGYDGTLAIIIDTIIYETGFWGWTIVSAGNGVYAPLTGISFTQGDQIGTVIDKDTVTTINDASYNVKCDRSPKIGALSKDTGWAAPGSYPNVLYYEDIDDRVTKLLPYEVAWDQGATMPLPVAIHKQILCYHHSTMQKLDGDFIIDRQDKWRPHCALEYHGHYFLLQRGTYDFITRRMTGALLREYELYDDLWTD